jgi:putative protein-disulfide isomerase
MISAHLIYFADPMCSWCWGFSPVITAISERYGNTLPIRLVMGGLRPGAVKPMDEASKASTRSHWEHVQKASGQPFDFAFFERESFVYDTEPASRAVVVARRRSMADALAMLRHVHTAFYASNQDVTDAATLTGIAGGIGFDPASFRAEFDGAAAVSETQSDFAIAQGAGIRGFPALVAGKGGDTYALITQGFQPAERILPAVERWLAEAQVNAR